MFPFLTFLLFFMAVSLSSGRSRKGKASADAPSLLEQHLPKSAQTLISPLSDDDREVLTYMLAFGLHVQMLAGVVFPACKLQWKPWKDSYVKVGLKREHAFPAHSMCAKSRSGPKKASSLFAHKPSCSCDCFSCYSSFWSRWAVSPNRDLLNKIIEIAEMPEDEEEQKASKGKDKKKMQEKKRVSDKEAGSRGGKWKLQSLQTTSKPPASSLATEKMVESMPATPNMSATAVCTSMDVMYDALWDNVSKDEEILSMGVDKMGAWSSVSTMRNQNTRDACRSWEASSWGSPKHGTAPAIVADEVDGRFDTQASPGGLLFTSTQVKNSLKFQRTGKRKSNQIAPLDFEGTFIVTEEDQEPDVVNESVESTESPRQVDVNNRGRGFLSRVFPDSLCDIASRLWDLVSLGSRSRTMEYY